MLIIIAKLYKLDALYLTNRDPSFKQLGHLLPLGCGKVFRMELNVVSKHGILLCQVLVSVAVDEIADGGSNQGVSDVSLKT